MTYVYALIPFKTSAELSSLYCASG